MRDLNVKFNKLDRPEFFQELRKRVNDYFTENQISKKGNAFVLAKSILLYLIYFIPFALMLTGLFHSTLAVMGLWLIMVFGMAGIGFIMHDANHGNISSNKYINNFFLYSSNFIGAFHTNWTIQHNVLHHTFTNIDGLDEDIDREAVIRFSPIQKRKYLFIFQMFYGPFLYSLMLLYWVFIKDFDQLIRYHKQGLYKNHDLSFKSALAKIIFYKLLYLTFTIGLPLLLTDISLGTTILGFVLMHGLCGLLLSIVFQSAHVVEKTGFYKLAEDNSIENNWAIHQMHTTANFARGNRWITWYLAGLNHQVEHHLFPTICHIHLPAVSKIVKTVATEYKVPYHEYKTFASAAFSHFRMLNQLGTGRYDRIRIAEMMEF